MNNKLVSSYIDHTLLKPDVSFAQIKQLCMEALKYNFHSVCINPSLINEAIKYLIVKYQQNFIIAVLITQIIIMILILISILGME